LKTQAVSLGWVEATKSEEMPVNLSVKDMPVNLSVKYMPVNLSVKVEDSKV
jgi:hypothetical protein